jgi:hypothetical protein
MPTRLSLNGRSIAGFWRDLSFGPGGRARDRPLPRIGPTGPPFAKASPDNRFVLRLPSFKRAPDQSLPFAPFFLDLAQFYFPQSFHTVNLLLWSNRVLLRCFPLEIHPQT